MLKKFPFQRWRRCQRPLLRWGSIDCPRSGLSSYGATISSTPPVCLPSLSPASYSLRIFCVLCRVVTFSCRDAKIETTKSCLPPWTRCGRASTSDLTPPGVADSWPLDELPEDVVAVLTELASGLVEWRGRAGECGGQRVTISPISSRSRTFSPSHRDAR